MAGHSTSESIFSERTSQHAILKHGLTLCTFNFAAMGACKQQLCSGSVSSQRLLATVLPWQSVKVQTLHKAVRGSSMSRFLLTMQTCSGGLQSEICSFVSKLSLT